MDDCIPAGDVWCPYTDVYQIWLADGNCDNPPLSHHNTRLVHRAAVPRANFQPRHTTIQKTQWLRRGFLLVVCI